MPPMITMIKGVDYPGEARRRFREVDGAGGGLGGSDVVEGDPCSSVGFCFVSKRASCNLHCSGV